jgi:hypothetical protein
MYDRRLVRMFVVALAARESKKPTRGINIHDLRLNMRLARVTGSKEFSPNIEYDEFDGSSFAELDLRAFPKLYSGLIRRGFDRFGERFPRMIPLRMKHLLRRHLEITRWDEPNEYFLREQFDPGSLLDLLELLCLEPHR